MAVAASHAAAIANAANVAMINLSLIDEYTDILSAEVSIDISKLRELARLHGIPPQFRGDVWLYLLGISPADRSHELSSARLRTQTYETMCNTAMISPIANDIIKYIRNDYSRYLRRVPMFIYLTQHINMDQIRHLFERIIITYLNHHSNFDYDSAWVHVLAPFITCIQHERDIYFSFETFMNKLDNHHHSLSQQMTNVLGMLRTSLPDVYNYLDEEEVDVRAWLPNWLQYGFSTELPFDSVLRLWDAYMAEPNHRSLLQLHPFVCLAVFHQLKESLEDMEASEVIAILRSLPFQPTDIDTLLHIAKNLWLETQHDFISDDDMYHCSGGNSSNCSSNSSSRASSR